MDLLQIIKKAAVEAVEASKPTVPVEGTVVSASPLKIKVDQMQILESEFLVLTEAVKKHTAKVTVDWDTATSNSHSHSLSGKKDMTVHGLEVGDRVVMLRSAGGQKFYVLGVI